MSGYVRCACCNLPISVSWDDVGLTVPCPRTGKPVGVRAGEIQRVGKAPAPAAPAAPTPAPKPAPKPPAPRPAASVPTPAPKPPVAPAPRPPVAAPRPPVPVPPRPAAAPVVPAPRPAPAVAAPRGPAPAATPKAPKAPKAPTPNKPEKPSKPSKPKRPGRASPAESLPLASPFEDSREPIPTGSTSWQSPPKPSRSGRRLALLAALLLVFGGGVAFAIYGLPLLKPETQNTANAPETPANPALPPVPGSPVTGPATPVVPPPDPVVPAPPKVDPPMGVVPVAPVPRPVASDPAPMPKMPDPAPVPVVADPPPVPKVPVAKAETTGAEIYKELCARCHGATGGGTKKAPLPLAGDRSVPQLAAVIDRTMPEEDPDALDAAGAKKVAEYIFDAFYSPAAQAKIKPPRPELSHLTVRQYRNAVAEVVGTFRPTAKFGDSQGLRGEYFNSRNFQNNKRLIDRTDPVVDFDFRKDGPKSEKELKEKFDPHQFSVRWSGAVVAPDTGLYEFVVRTDHAFRLWVNEHDFRTPTVDAWVKSGTDTEFRTSVFLLAGRAYPIKLEFSKAKQGVDDSKKNPNPPVKPAFVSLNWKRPKGAVEVIPARHLSPGWVPEVCVVEAPFPPDDRSLGWERGTGVSKEWEAATTDAAIAAAAYVLEHLPELSGTPAGSKDDPKLRDFCKKFTERAFRRRLTDDEKKLFVDRAFDAAAGDTDLAVKTVVLLALKSPRFLYPEAGDLPEQYAVASRLALALWDSNPDMELLSAANEGKLGDAAAIEQHARRMLNDPRGKAKLREFLFVWLKLDQATDPAKDAKKFPGFDPALAADLRTSLELFLDDIVWGTGDFRDLLLSNEMYVNDRLARFYGLKPTEPIAHPLKAFGFVTHTPDPGFRKVKFEPDRRAGVVTHPYLMAVLAYNTESSPIHRGVFVARGLLGITIRPPQDAFTPLPAEKHPNLSTRERVALQTKPAACGGCHSVMNPLGFALENFDAVGRFRDKDADKPVDAAGSYFTRSGDTAKFAGAQELARFLADSPEVAETFVERLFHHYVKQPIMAYGVTRPDELRKSFSAQGYDVRKLVIEVATIAATKK